MGGDASHHEARVKSTTALERFDGSLFVWFHCPGCGSSHRLRVDPPDRHPCWTWNGDRLKPTFTPSILSAYDSGPARERRVCHSFVTDGRIQFLSDCTHALRGQTVDLVVEDTPE
jgi:Family of unknown function (DUF6527)